MKAFHIVMLAAALCMQGLPAAAAPKEPGEAPVSELKRAVVANYAAIASAGYQGALDSAKRLQTAVNALLARASDESLRDARQAWLSAHQAYSLTEVFRFYDGPIDQVEGLVNSWPIDASYIDFVADAPDSGIVNASKDYPAISRELLISLNAKDGKQNVSTGFHAIEFLLWGQPPGGRGAGNRSWRDFADGGKNADRRRDYLRIVMDLLVENLHTVASEWEAGQKDNFRGKFLAMDPDVAMAAILKGMGALSGPELSGERLTTAYETKERTEQQNCFSNSTCDDLIAAAVGIQNVFLGCYKSASGGNVEGSGVFDLLRKANPDFADKLSVQVSATVAATQNIPHPFDQAILGTNQSPNRIAMKKAITALQTQSDMIAQAAKVLSIKMEL
jgi:putative iron-regulated protein